MFTFVLELLRSLDVLCRRGGLGYGDVVILSKGGKTEESAMLFTVPFYIYLIIFYFFYSYNFFGMQ